MKRKRKKWNKKDNKVVLPYYFKKQPYTKSIQEIELWEKAAMFHTTNQRTADQARVIQKKGRISELEIMGMCVKVSIKENTQENFFKENRQKRKTQEMLKMTILQNPSSSLLQQT